MAWKRSSAGNCIDICTSTRAGMLKETVSVHSRHINSSFTSATCHQQVMNRSSHHMHLTQRHHSITSHASEQLTRGCPCLRTGAQLCSSCGWLLLQSFPKQLQAAIHQRHRQLPADATNYFRLDVAGIAVLVIRELSSSILCTIASRTASA